MSGYMKFYDDAPKWLRIVLSVFGIFAFLYRLFGVIIDKAKKTENLVYLILNVVPIIGFIILVFDIVKCATGKALPLNFAEMLGNDTVVVNEEKVEEEKKDEE